MQLPAGTAFGEVSAVDIDSHGHVFVLHRAGRAWKEPFPAAAIADPTVFMFDATGKLLAKWGAEALTMPHGLSIDDADRLWITDVGREQVLRFSHDGALQQTLGEAGVTGDDDAHFGRPADVAFSRNRVLVADGYLNRRLAIFDEAGAPVQSWRPAGGAAFNVPHAVAVEGDRIFVADRENSRIHVFSTDGRSLAVWNTPGHPYAVKALPNGSIVSLEGRDAADRTGAIIRVHDQAGQVLHSYDVGLPGENTSLGHDIAIAADGTVYLADNRGNRVVRFRLPESEQE